MKVSVCIPAYNQVDHLRRTLASVLMQNFSDYELIVSDDSPDTHVRELLGEFDFGDRLRYFHNAPPLGSPENWNFCTGQARGEYIKLMHHDDQFYDAGSLSEFVKALDAHPEVCFAFSSAYVYEERAAKTRLHSPNHYRFIDDLPSEPSVLFFGNLVGPPSSVIYRREPALKFDARLKWLVDVDFYMRLMQQCPGFHYIDKPLVLVLSDIDSSMTAACMSDKNVELVESFYLYDKLMPVLRGKSRWAYCRYLGKLLSKYNVGPGYLGAAGYDGRIETGFSLLLSGLSFYFSIKPQLRKFKYILGHAKLPATDQA